MVGQWHCGPALELERGHCRMKTAWFYVFAHGGDTPLMFPAPLLVLSICHHSEDAG